MDVESYSNVTELVTSLLRSNGLPGVKSSAALQVEDADNPMGLASSTKTLTLNLRDDSVLHLFLKVRTDGSQVEQLDKVFSLFARERIMYGTILPMLSKFQEENTKDNLEPEFRVGRMFPKYYGAGLVNKDLWLVFENILQDTGRYVTSKTDFHTEDQILLCMRQLAVFHSVSYCFQLRSKKNFLEDFPILEEPVFHPDRCDHIRFFFQGMFQKHLKIIKVIREEYEANNKTVVSKIERMCSERDLHELTRRGERLMEAIYDLTQPENLHSVITHGDFHMWNIAFQGRDPPHQAVFFDLQVSRSCSGVTDIVQYLYQVTTPQQRRLSVSHYLAAYSQAFRASADSLGLEADSLGLEADLPVSSPSWLMAEYDRLAVWGLMYGQCVLHRFVENSQQFDKMDAALEEDNHQEILNIITDSGPKMWWVMQLLIDMIIEYK